MYLDCRRCERQVDAEAKAESYGPDDDVPTRYTLLSCPTCSDPFLITQENYGQGWESPELLYPPSPHAVASPNLPPFILIAFREAATCFKGKAYTATALMCRKALEGLASEQGAAEGPLVKRLKSLKDSGVIDSRLYAWSDALRMVGNEAAHDIEATVSGEDARDLLDFTNALLEYVFTFRQKFDAFMQRRKARLPQPDNSDEPEPDAGQVS